MHLRFRFHQNFYTNLDLDAVNQLEKKVSQMRKNSTDLELYYTLLTAWLIGEASDVKDLSEQLGKNFPDFKQVKRD